MEGFWEWKPSAHTEVLNFGNWVGKDGSGVTGEVREVGRAYGLGLWAPGPMTLCPCGCFGHGPFLATGRQGWGPPPPAFPPHGHSLQGTQSRQAANTEPDMQNSGLGCPAGGTQSGVRVSKAAAAAGWGPAGARSCQSPFLLSPPLWVRPPGLTAWGASCSHGGDWGVDRRAATHLRPG